MIRLKDLLREEDIVKNKKTGNVYVVKQFDPSKHDKPTPAEVDKAKAANGGQLPKGEKPSTVPSPKPQQQKQAPAAQKIGAADFKSGAEKGDTKQSTGKTTGADDMKLKSLMPGMDTSKKTLAEVPPIERQKISTIIDDLAKAGAEAKAKGEKAPNFNLCKVTIPGTNLYCDGNKGIERADMPQFKGTPRPGSPADKLPKDENGEADTEEFFSSFGILS